MRLLQRTLNLVRPSGKARMRSERTTARRLLFEPLEIRQVLSTVPFNLVNNSTVDSSGTLAYQDDQIFVALYAQDFSSTTPPFYYFDASGDAHLTSTVTPDGAGNKVVPTFKLSDLTQTGAHSYVINLPEQLPAGAPNGINSARLYFSMNVDMSLTINPDAVGSVNALSPNNSFFDFFEFSLNAPANPVGNLNIDTTNVDQFGIPLKIQVDSTDPNNLPDGVGIDATRASVISQFQQFTSSANDPFAICVWPTSDPTYGPYRILNPSGVLSQVQPAINLLQVQTTLQKPIGVTDTTVNVYSAAAFPNPTSNFTIEIGNELMTVTGATQNSDGTTNWTVTRGQQGTTAVGHSSGSAVTTPDPALSASQTSLTVAGTIGFPDTFGFRIRVESEIMLVTGLKSSNLDGTTTWNVLRGQDGTIAAPHNEHTQVFYSAVTNIALNGYFNAAIDALFTKYHNTPDTLTVYSNADGTGRSYVGTVVQDANGAYVLRFTIESDPTSVEYDVYYPFFEDNSYFWGGYTPALTPAAAPSWSAGADVSAISPSTMVFSCNGVFADNTFRTAAYTADQQKVLADLENQTVSALNRGVALLQGYTVDGMNSWKDGSLYYENNPDGQVWNHYAQFFHKDTVSIDGKNYGFAFDDQDGHASDIGVASFNSVTATLEPWATTAPDPDPDPDPDSSGISQRRFMASRLAQQVPPQGSPPVQSSSVFAPSETSSPSAVDAALASALAIDDADLFDPADLAVEADGDEPDFVESELLPSLRNFLSSRRR